MKEQTHDEHRHPLLFKNVLVHGETGAGAYTDLVARRLGANGKVVDSQRQVLTTAVDPPYRVFWTGSEFAVFWDDERSGFGGRTLMARLKQDGTLIATDLPVFTSGLVNQGSAGMPVAWSGSS